MLQHNLWTIPAEIRDFPEWRRGRYTYAVWILHLEDKVILERFNAAKEHLSGYLLEPYRRQPHITLFVCGFLVEQSKYNDDFTRAQFECQIQAMDDARIKPFEIKIGGLNSFASAPFLEVSDPQCGIARLREALSHGAREFRTAPYNPHLTVGLYAGEFPNKDVAERLFTFPDDPTTLKIEEVAFATYQAQEIAGPLTIKHNIFLNSNRRTSLNQADSSLNSF